MAGLRLGIGEPGGRGVVGHGGVSELSTPPKAAVELSGSNMVASRGAGPGDPTAVLLCNPIYVIHVTTGSQVARLLESNPPTMANGDEPPQDVSKDTLSEQKYTPAAPSATSTPVTQFTGSARAEDRSLLLSQARSFLQSSPQITNQDTFSKRQFLLEKGLHESEIESLLRDVRLRSIPSSTGLSLNFQPRLLQPP